MKNAIDFYTNLDSNTLMIVFLVLGIVMLLSLLLGTVIYSDKTQKITNDFTKDNRLVKNVVSQKRIIEILEGNIKVGFDIPISLYNSLVTHDFDNEKELKEMLTLYYQESKQIKEV